MTTLIIFVQIKSLHFTIDYLDIVLKIMQIFKNFIIHMFNRTFLAVYVEYVW